MKKTSLLILPALLAGCATIFDGSTKAVTIGSDPDGATFVVANRAGKVVHSGKTPQRVTLDNGASYFVSEKYTLTLKKPGYEDTTAALDTHIAGWYFGNLILGGALGMLIVDPITGAMYQLPDNTVIPMRKLDGTELASAGSTVAAYDPAATAAGAKALPDNLRWMFQAEQAAAQMNCTNTAYSAQGPGVEFYTAHCGANQISIRCDFGRCAELK